MIGGQGNDDGIYVGPARGCSYKDFTNCKPIDFNGKGGATAYIQWMEKTEAVIAMSRCAANQRILYVTGSLIADALTWWNSEIQTRGRNAALAMSWEEFKRLMQAKFCPVHELQRLQIQFTHQSMVGADYDGYTNRFHELARLVPHLVTPEQNRIKKYIFGLEKHVQVLVSSAGPTTFQEAVTRAGRVTEYLVRSGVLSRDGNKRKDVAESSGRKQGRYDGKRQKKGKVFAAVEAGQKE